MRKRRLGRTGLEVSELAFGGVEIGMPYGIDAATAMPGREEAIQLLHASLDAGIDFFDTARLYGESESIMGEAFLGMRQRVIIGSKCRHLRSEDGSIPVGKALRDAIGSSLQESLKALRTDYLDLFMLHQADEEILGHPGIAELFTGLRRQGVIRATGVSVYLPEDTRLAIDSGHWDVVQAPFNLMDQRQAQSFAQAERRGVGIVVRSVLLKGLLSEKGRGLSPELASVEAHIRKLDRLAEELQWTLPALATRFALSFPEVSSVLVGIDKAAYLQKATEAADGRYLDAAMLARARLLAYPDAGFLNLHDWSVKGWLK